jgi:AAA15 family ATPase/GTPase
MNFKESLEGYLGDLLKTDPKVKEYLDKISPNDSTVKKILDKQSESNSQEGENEMAKFEKQESEYISGNDLVGIEGVTFKILTEVREESSNFGMKPKCSVEVLKQGVTTARKWTLNQQNVNFLIDSYGEESATWIGKSFGVFIENIKGNNAIRVKA